VDLELTAEAGRAYRQRMSKADERHGVPVAGGAYRGGWVRKGASAGQGPKSWITR
jgi:hypothetical protein